VHIDDERVHRCELLVGRMNDQVGPFSNDLQVVIGDQRGDLDDHFRGVIQAGHFEIHPNKHSAKRNGPGAPGR
jgi:hypothetical protein